MPIHEDRPECDDDVHMEGRKQYLVGGGESARSSRSPGMT